jgi:hypothetical protein
MYAARPRTGLFLVVVGSDGMPNVVLVLTVFSKGHPPKPFPGKLPLGSVHSFRGVQMHLEVDPCPALARSCKICMALHGVVWVWCNKVLIAVTCC